MNLSAVAVFGLCLTFLISLFSTGCTDSESSPEQSLRTLGYNFSTEDFFRAAKAGDELAVQRFVESGMPVNQTGPNGDTALIEVSSAGHVSLAQKLISFGASINFAGRFKRNALHNASANGHGETVKFLLNSGANPKLKDAKGWTPLTLAAYGGHASATRRLAPVSKSNLDDAILVAAIGGNPDVIDALLEAGAIADTHNASGKTPLMMAAQNGNLEAVRLLIQRGANPFTQDVDGSTAADLAASNGRSDVQQLLNQSRLQPSSPNSARSGPRLLVASAAPALTSPPTALTPVSSLTAEPVPQRPTAGTNRPLLHGQALSIDSNFTDDYLHEFFELRNFVNDPLPLTLVSAQLGTATVRLLYGDDQPQTAYEGRIIGDTGLQVVSITPRLMRTPAGGPMVDASEMVLRDQSSGREHILVSGMPANGSGAFAIIGYKGSGDTEFDLRRGDEFQIRRGGVSQKFRVTAVGPTQVMIENLNTHQVVQLRRHDRPADRL
ncbi:MAG: ankyrin repeat protein [Verrucomicrobiales bacterium]|jgi:ankyrin repeat protein